MSAPPLRLHASVQRDTARARCSLPLKALVTGTIDMARVSALAPPSHSANVREAAAILDGSHPAWNALWGQRSHRTTRGLTASQLHDAAAMGLLRETRVRPAMTSPMYAVPKADGVTSRPIYDARTQNAFVDWSAVKARLRLLRPLAHVRVGLAVGVRDPLLLEVDATSYFPSFRWSGRLARHHGVEAAGRYYVHRAPAQGSS